ncbi:MAG: 4Fe-4S ferredoxin [Ignisphaera sp.]|uniref:4Fe-4S ferredoxin n=1 Tax=Ignisphaera aggregans TaxID=334771 RepID=A0A832C9J2_9CREN
MSSLCTYASCSFVWSTWVKTPALKGKDLLIASACLPIVNPTLFQEISRDKFILLACPEKEPTAYYGKIASIIRSTEPRSITVVTIDGSPHCFALQASVNEAEYILSTKINKKHFVVVNGIEIREISPNTIRVARYLHLVDNMLKKVPNELKKLEYLSLEYRNALKTELQKDDNNN